LIIVRVEVLNALVFERPSGVPNTAAALTTMYQTVFTSGRGARSGVPHIAIVVTSGLSTSISATAAAAEAARRSGVDIYAVAYTSGGRPDMEEIRRIANTNGGTYVLTLGDSTGTPPSVANTLLDRLCQA